MKTTLNPSFFRVAVLISALAILLIPNLSFAAGSDLSVTQATSLSGNSTIVNNPFNLIFTVTNANATSTFSTNAIIFSTTLAPKATFGPTTVVKSSGVIGDIECKVSGLFTKSLDCKANGSVSMGASSTITMTVRVTPTAIGTFVNPRATSKTHCKVDYTSSINGDVFETNESNNNCTPQSLSINITSATATGANLILNPSVEVANSNNASLPQNWLSSSWGTNNTVFTYPIAGQDGQKGLQIDVSSYTDGDARFEFTDIPVKPLEIYTFSDWYKSNTTTYPIIRFTNNDGSFYYFALRAADASTNWKQYSHSFRVPFTAKAMSISHTIKSVGFLSLDNYSLILK